MLTKYIDAAMKKAHYELMDDGDFWGEIPGFQGVWGTGKTLESCRDQLKSVLEGWLLLKLWDQDDDIPVVDKISLLPKPKYRRYAAAHSAPNR
jgi:predicted RNase H-like HicB family nuclease